MTKPDKTITVYTLQGDDTTTFAAQELRRYLLAMDALHTDIKPASHYTPGVKPGLYLGLFADVGMAAPVSGRTPPSTTASTWLSLA